MNAIVFATVGTSALTNRKIGDVVGKEHGGSLRNAASDYLDAEVGRRAHLARLSNLQQDLVESHAAYCRQEFRICLDPKQFSGSAAELTSMPGLLAAIEERGERLVRVVLIASGTPEGQLAAEVIRSVLMQPECFQLAPATVEVERVIGLDETFRDQYARLQEVVSRQIEQAGAPERVYLNLTGGFKGTVPFLTMIAREQGYALYYQHERQSVSEVVELSPGAPPQVFPSAVRKWTRG